MKGFVMAKMEWPKDRRKAFLWAAKAFGTPRNKRTGWQKSLTSHGICRVLHLLINLEGSQWLGKLGTKMEIRNTYWWPIRGCVRGCEGWRANYDKQRSLFCYLMAALSDKEFRDLQT